MANWPSLLWRGMIIKHASYCHLQQICMKHITTVVYFSYDGIAVEEAELEKAIAGGASSPEYTKLVEWLTKELCGYTGIEEHVCAIQSEFIVFTNDVLKYLL